MGESELSAMSEYVSNVEIYTGKKTLNHVGRKRLLLVEVTNYVHKRIQLKEKENRNDVIVCQNFEARLELARFSRSQFK